MIFDGPVSAVDRDVQFRSLEISSGDGCLIDLDGHGAGISGGSGSDYG
jgi:hypothetical protein